TDRIGVSSIGEHVGGIIGKLELRTIDPCLASVGIAYGRHLPMIHDQVADAIVKAGRLELQHVGWQRYIGERNGEPPLKIVGALLVQFQRAGGNVESLVNAWHALRVCDRAEDCERVVELIVRSKLWRERRMLARNGISDIGRFQPLEVKAYAADQGQTIIPD